MHMEGWYAWFIHGEVALECLVSRTLSGLDATLIAFKDVLTHWETEANALYKPLVWSHQLTATTQLKTSRQLILRKFTTDECTGAAGSMKLGQLADAHVAVAIAVGVYRL
ncbi:TPA: hypothetical protein ACH3X3_004925 [Trebouxia sp. C0006]